MNLGLYIIIIVLHSLDINLKWGAKKVALRPVLLFSKKVSDNHVLLFTISIIGDTVKTIFL